VLETVCSFSNEPDLGGGVKVLSGLDYELTDNQKTALIFLREVGAVDNITYRQLTGLSAREATAEIKQIESYDLIKMHGQGRRAYYTPTEKLMKMLSKGAHMEDEHLNMESISTGMDCNVPTSDSNATSSEPNVPTSDSNATSSEPNVPTSDSNATSSEPNVPTSDSNVPSSLRVRIDNLGKRVPLSQLQAIVLDLCKERPYSANELANILGRTEYHIIKRIIRPLMAEKKLFYTIPEMINHPQQKYTAIPKLRSKTDGINR